VFVSEWDVRMARQMREAGRSDAEIRENLGLSKADMAYLNRRLKGKD